MSFLVKHSEKQGTVIEADRMEMRGGGVLLYRNKDESETLVAAIAGGEWLSCIKQESPSCK
jgi:hypothetical protein